MKLVRRVVDRIVDYFMVVMFIIIFLVVLTQILFRYVLATPLVWSEELSRYIFIWVSLMGWVMATRHDTHIRITFFQERMPPPVRKVLNALFTICTLGFLAVLAWLGWEMSMRTFGRGAVTIPQIPMGLVYAALPVSAVLGIFYLVLDLIDPILPNKTTPVSGQAEDAA